MAKLKIDRDYREDRDEYVLPTIERLKAFEKENRALCPFCGEENGKHVQDCPGEFE